MRVSPRDEPNLVPILFGSESDQALLLRVFRDGRIPFSSRTYLSKPLSESGLVTICRSAASEFVTLDVRHPAILSLLRVLEFLNDAPGTPYEISAIRSDYAINVARPLAHRSTWSFRILAYLARNVEPVSVAVLRAFFQGSLHADISSALQRLVEDRIVCCEAEKYIFADQVREQFAPLILEIAEVLQRRDPQLSATYKPQHRRASFLAPIDGAPLLFGTDIRLRNLMALAVHGALYSSELARVTHSAKRVEGYDMAPFGRGNLVLTWTDKRGMAAALDPMYPLYLPLRRLLLRLSTAYPLVSLGERTDIPQLPESRPWHGDKEVLFGSAIHTSILFTIGANDWAFEGLCVSAAVGYDRVVVKRAIRALEQSGILCANRSRRPGFDVRQLRICSNFLASPELLALLRSAVHLWPEIKERTNSALNSIPLKTKLYLEKRGLLNHDFNLQPDSTRREPRERLRKACINKYYQVASAAGVNPSSADLVQRGNMRLYRDIIAAFGNFAQFRVAAGVVLASDVKNSSRFENRELCLAQYLAISRSQGRFITSGDLNAKYSSLYSAILNHWGSISSFFSTEHIGPRQQRRRFHSLGDLRQSCEVEFSALQTRLGAEPTSTAVRRYSEGLYKRISRGWPNFEAFRNEMRQRPMS